MTRIPTHSPSSQLSSTTARMSFSLALRLGIVITPSFHSGFSVTTDTPSAWSPCVSRVSMRRTRSRTSMMGCCAGSLSLWRDIFFLHECLYLFEARVHVDLRAIVEHDVRVRPHIPLEC